jgi:hypothetical protein
MHHSEQPKLWRDMSPEEKGALLLAWWQRQEVEVFCHLRKMWVVEPPMFLDGLAYRVKTSEDKTHEPL